MADISLVPPQTVVREKGEGTPADVSSLAGKVLLLTLSITEILEQQALDVSVWGSPDGNNWSDKPLLAFPQKFYRGQHPLLLDLSKHPGVKFLRARWDVNRWGRHAEGPRFEFRLDVKEVPQQVLAETRGHAVS